MNKKKKTNKKQTIKQWISKFRIENQAINSFLTICFSFVWIEFCRTCYNANPRPDALMKEQLVEMTGLSPRVIRVWFQNKRCKDKKKTIQMKLQMQQEKVSSNLIVSFYQLNVWINFERFVYAFLGRTKVRLRCNARNTNGGNFTSSSRFAIEFARTRSDVISATVESVNGIRIECRFGKQRN